jgi:hypothetical protein
MDINLSSLIGPINRFVGKYHPTIFLTIVGLLLASAIFLLYLILQIPSSPDPEAANSATISRTFDNGTIKQVQQLRESNETISALSFPTPRSNPFVE